MRSKLPDQNKPIGTRSVAAAVQYQSPLKNKKEPPLQMQAENTDILDVNDPVVREQLMPDKKP